MLSGSSLLVLSLHLLILWEKFVTVRLSRLIFFVQNSPSGKIWKATTNCHIALSSAIFLNNSNSPVAPFFFFSGVLPITLIESFNFFILSRSLFSLVVFMGIFHFRNKSYQIVHHCWAIYSFLFIVMDLFFHPFFFSFLIFYFLSLIYCNHILVYVHKCWYISFHIVLVKNFISKLYRWYYLHVYQLPFTILSMSFHRSCSE